MNVGLTINISSVVLQENKRINVTDFFLIMLFLLNSDVLEIYINTLFIKSFKYFILRK